MQDRPRKISGRSQHALRASGAANSLHFRNLRLTHRCGSCDVTQSDVVGSRQTQEPMLREGLRS